MRTNLSRLLMISGAALIVITSDSALADISISGVVHTFENVPVNMIEVTIYRDDKEIDHVFTGEDGKYNVSVPEGKPITVRFDTHYSLTNSRDWHPSVVANIDATKDTSVDRILLRVGQGQDNAASIDALSGYEFGAFWEERSPNKEYADSAAGRLAMMKLPIQTLQEFQRKLQDHFLERARGP